MSAEDCIPLRQSQNYLWDITKLLGQGATSKVYKGRDKRNGEEVAVKVFSLAAMQRSPEVQMREFQDVNSHKVIVMELSQYGSLYTLLDDPKNSLGLEEDEFLIVLRDLTAGIQYLREKDIVHRDIKPGNILLFKDEEGRSVYKLTDFGAAKQLESEDEQFMSLYGTEEYLHPNIYGRAVIKDGNTGPFDATVDLWSLGVTIYHAATGQLPFKAYGGRRNRHKMYEITKTKESGILSGIQKYEDGPVEWSRDLPLTCLLSVGLKKFLVPLLASLLESNERKRTTFDRFFQEVGNLMSKKVLNAFCPVTWSNMRIYIRKDTKLSHLQEVIAEQCEVAAVNQILVLDGELLEHTVDPLTPVSKYPKSITPDNPIFVFLKSYPDHRYFPNCVYPEFPRFGSSVHVSNDYQLSKLCCTVMAFHLRLVKQYHQKLQLLQTSVSGYIHELQHEIIHLVDYLRHQKQHNQTCQLWTKNYNHSVAQNTALVRGADQGAGAKDRERLLEGNQIYIRDLEKQVENIMKGAEDQLSQIQRDELQNKRLEHYWDDENMACHSDTYRCGEKIGIMLESMRGIMIAFKEDRHRAVLGKLEENIHMVEKNRLQTLCSKSLSILESCNRCTEKQYNAYYMWYNQAVDTRKKCDKVNLKLGHLEKRQNEFVNKLDEFSKAMIGSMHEIVCEPNFKTSNNDHQKRKHSVDLINKINNRLESVGLDVLAITQHVDENSKIINSTEKHIIENDV
ncbi:inhibitor of nuclear factor kappa-B kinase subunit epsilon-like isoform X2 [Ostrea edulis]|uniref:inhibitor of nuclear factor kappa-B kinase subunit epsilon-like isoform X2 n=1 Tax=Ostrea edulis TaxID=37623 RepID=UPI002094B096|nr:inhibitor of nuclear factor kappa-B kinase subunit epsilon-like isoform X2 [Ostrea edulis]